jgi:hypothetical protein
MNAYTSTQETRNFVLPSSTLVCHVSANLVHVFAAAFIVVYLIISKVVFLITCHITL